MSVSGTKKEKPISCLQCAAVCMECATADYTAMEPASATLHTPAPTATSVSTTHFLNATPGRRGTGVCISDSAAQGNAVLCTLSSALCVPMAHRTGHQRLVTSLCPSQLTQEATSLTHTQKSTILLRACLSASGPRTPSGSRLLAPPCGWPALEGRFPANLAIKAS